MAGSESGTEELECLATWSEGSKHYLVAEMDREHVFSDESKYRCFVYSKAGKGDNRTVKMAQSLAATCTGLWSPVEGYRTFQLEKGVFRQTENCLVLCQQLHQSLSAIISPQSSNVSKLSLLQWRGRGRGASCPAG